MTTPAVCWALLGLAGCLASAPPFRAPTSRAGEVDLAPDRAGDLVEPRSPAHRAPEVANGPVSSGDAQSRARAGTDAAQRRGSISSPSRLRLPLQERMVAQVRGRGGAGAVGSGDVDRSTYLGRAAAGAAAVSVLLLWPSIGGLVAATAAVVGVPPLIDRLNQRRPAPSLLDADVPLLADLVAAVLRSGAPLSTALRQVAAAASDREPPLVQELARVGGLLSLGAEPDQAWRRIAADPELAELARVACRSNESGIRLAESFERLATQLRRRRAIMVQLRAERVGVWAVAPLGLCFLPAFLCLGIAPVVIGIGRVIFASVSP